MRGHGRECATRPNRNRGKPCQNLASSRMRGKHPQAAGEQSGPTMRATGMPFTGKPSGIMETVSACTPSAPGTSICGFAPADRRSVCPRRKAWRRFSVLRPGRDGRPHACFRCAKHRMDHDLRTQTRPTGMPRFPPRSSWGSSGRAGTDRADTSRQTVAGPQKLGDLSKFRRSCDGFV